MGAVIVWRNLKPTTAACAAAALKCTAPWQGERLMDRSMVESTDLVQRVDTLETLSAEIRTELRWRR